MFDWIHQRWKKKSVIKIRKWNEEEDSLRLFTLEQQGMPDCDERQLSFKRLCEQMKNPAIYGAVITDNENIEGFVAAYLAKTHEMMIYALHIDESSDLKKYGTLLINHLLAIRGIWGKIFLSIKIGEDEENMRRFLMNDNGFVITEMNECFEDPSDPAYVVYTLRYPPPEGFNPKKITIFVNGEEKAKCP